MIRRRGREEGKRRSVGRVEQEVGLPSHLPPHRC